MKGTRVRPECRNHLDTPTRDSTCLPQSESQIRIISSSSHLGREIHGEDRRTNPPELFSNAQVPTGLADVRLTCSVGDRFSIRTTLNTWLSLWYTFVTDSIAAAWCTLSLYPAQDPIADTVAKTVSSQCCFVCYLHWKQSDPHLSLAVAHSDRRRRPEAIRLPTEQEFYRFPAAATWCSQSIYRTRKSFSDNRIGAAKFRLVQRTGWNQSLEQPRCYERQAWDPRIICIGSATNYTAPQQGQSFDSVLLLAWAQEYSTEPEPLSRLELAEALLRVWQSDLSFEPLNECSLRGYRSSRVRWVLLWLWMSGLGERRVRWLRRLWVFVAVEELAW